MALILVHTCTTCNGKLWCFLFPVLFSFLPHSVKIKIFLSLIIFLIFQGRITVTGLLDRERGDVYTLTVVADDGGPKKDSTVVGCCILNAVMETLSLCLS